MVRELLYHLLAMRLIGIKRYLCQLNPGQHSGLGMSVTEKSVPGHKCPRSRYIFVKKKSVPGGEFPRHLLGLNIIAIVSDNRHVRQFFMLNQYMAPSENV